MCGFIKCKYRQNGVIYALRIIDKRNFNQTQLLSLESDINIMREISHTNLNRMYDLFDSRSKLCIVEYYMEGGQLLDVMRTKQHYSERDVVRIIAQILQGLLHYRQKQDW